MGTPAAYAEPYPRSGWRLCRARLCHPTWVEGETAVKQTLIFLPPHASFLPGQRPRP